MGGITNRDAKRTKNKVFSSGGGGGTKGAAVVDKRGQELQCPYCDRLFKQTGRLQDHVKKQHEAEEADAAADGTHPPLAAVPAAAAPAARAPAPAAPAAPPAAPRMMDVGSAAGAYDVKSPKLLLHELLLRDKQPRPRYKASLAPDGAWRCKVVLPHPKQPSDKDVVVFLDDAHAAPTEEEAAQRAAVAALHRVAGDRALDRLLPRPYLAQWQELGRRRQEREAREARDEERRAGRALATAAAARRRQPAAVIMTEDKRRLVESIIAEARDAGASSSAGFDDNDDDGGEQGGGGGAWESLGDVDGGGGAGGGLPMGPAALQEELVALGFREDDARRAVAVSCAGGAAPALSPALDWLCLNLEEDELPASFAPGAAGKPLTVLLRAPSSGDGGAGASRGSLSSAEAEAEAAAAAAAAALEDDPAAAELAAFGYPPAMCVQALREAGGHLHEAVRRLYGQLAAAAAAAGAAGAPPSTAAAAAGDAAAAAPDEWLEERVALEAIYGGDATFHSATWTSLRLSVLLDGAAARAAARHSGRPREAFAVDGAEVELQAWAPAAAAGCYPRAAPVLALRSPDVPPAALLTLTHRLAALCASLAGHPMLYEAASAAADQLPACLAAPRPARELFDDGADAAAAQLAAASLQGGAPPAGRRGRPAAGDRRGGGRAPTPAELAAESRRLLQAQRDLAGSAKHAAMRATRQRLPAFAQRGEVVAAVAGCRAVVVSGATGCGKSTQVPQYLLEEAVEGGAGGACNIVCTQPRRISAVGVATRVAAERGEAVGDVVGYSVRLDSKRSHRTRLLFCTTGVLLRRLLSDPGLEGTTHVILDEVHERSIESDLLLMLLRRVVAGGLNPGLRVVLMSATADAGLFAGYFAPALGRPAATLTIPGFTHPVTDLFLEDALEETGFLVGRSSKWAKKDAPSSSSSSSSRGGGGGGGGAGTKGAGAKKKGKGGEGAGAGGAASWDEAQGDAGGSSAPAPAEYSAQTAQSLALIDESLVNYDLIEAVVAHVAARERGARGGAPGAVLVFAPGAEEIGRVVRALQGSGRVAAAAPGGLRVLPLHGGLPPSHQARVFERPPPGVLKVVVATNVAETSITIDDVTCVIDAGRVKEMGFDPGRGIARLLEGWVSRASAAQRRGRAGRVRPGVCYRLYSRATWEGMAADTPPEVSRAPLQGLVMDVKGILRGGDAEAALGEMVTPPSAGALAQAVGALQAIGALARAPGAPLTPLGLHLLRMPCDPRLGKMLVFGAMLRCLDPVLTVAAAQAHGRPAFFSPPDKRAEAEAARAALTRDVAASKSDHLATVAAYNEWRAAVARGGRAAGSALCARSFLSEQVMEGIHQGRRQYADILTELGFVPRGYSAAAAAHAYSPGGVGAAGGSAGAEAYTRAGGVDEFAGHARIVKAALCAGLYPQLLRVDHPPAKFAAAAGGAFEVDSVARELKFFDRERGRVFLHPSSSNFARGRFESGWLVFSELVQTSRVFVRESSMVPVYAVLLFGGELSVHHEHSLLRVDGWATFRAPGRIAVLVRALRGEVAALLGRKVVDPGVELAGSRVVEAMHHLLSSDGF